MKSITSKTTLSALKRILFLHQVTNFSPPWFKFLPFQFWMSFSLPLRIDLYLLKGTYIMLRTSFWLIAVCAGFLITTYTLLWNKFHTMHICVEGMEDKLYIEYWCLGGAIYPMFMELSFSLHDLSWNTHSSVYYYSAKNPHLSSRSFKCWHIVVLQMHTVYGAWHFFDV